MRRDIPAQRNPAVACECPEYVLTEFIGNEGSNDYACTLRQSTTNFGYLCEYAQDCNLAVNTGGPSGLRRRSSASVAPSLSLRAQEGGRPNCGSARMLSQSAWSGP